jgi:outer membrane lipoprotein-sorting protein
MEEMQKLMRGLALGLSLAIVVAGSLVSPAASFAANQAAPLALNADQQQAVRRVSDYLNSFQSLKASFNQVSPKGVLTTGTLYISKPGKLRFDYANNPLLIVADGRWLTIKDRVREKGDQFPLASTPLRLVVSPQIDLLAETNVIAFDSRDGITSVTLQDRKSNIGGYITLMFDEQLKQLQQWVAVDGKDRRTTVQLSRIETGGKFDPKLFVGEINRDQKQ